jgi:predicted nuclease of predicted toxin-antitoxin system
MPKTIRFHLDENCDGAIAAGLRLHGVDVTTTAEAGLAGAADREHVAFALAEGRVIFTHDSDFVSLHRAGVPHSGISYCHQQRHSLGELIRRLVLIWEVYERDEFRNRLEYL